jgi:O-antigen ligase
MTAQASGTWLVRPAAAPANHAVPLLQVFAAALMVFPADGVIKAIGAGGYVAALVAYAAFLAWIAATLFGLHNPLDHRYPVRFALCALWMVSLASYALMDRATLSSTQQLAADRWLLQLADVSGVILVTAEFLRSLADIRRVLRVLVWAASFCGVVAALQFWLSVNIAPWLLHLQPGFSVDLTEAANAVITSRGGLNRVVGTAIDPIELGVAAAMLLPLAVWLAMHDTGRPLVRRWLPVALIGICVPTSVSRSAILGAGAALGVYVVCLPATVRVKVMGALTLAVAGVFMVAHGLIGTLRYYFFAGTTDPSVAHRVNNYPYVEHMVRQAPWFGQGGGTFIPASVLNILDNQYLTTAIELGLVGMAVLAFFLVWPVAAALTARRRTSDPDLAALCAALAGSALAATLCSATFDSLSFPMFANVQALVLGLIGAAWLLAGREGQPAAGRPPPLRRPRYATANGRRSAGLATAGPEGGN